MFIRCYGVVLATFLLNASMLQLHSQVTPGKSMPSIVHVRVNAAGDLGKIPPRMFGGFIEPIDYSINNGVMAEILVNGSLEPELWNHAMLEPIYAEQPELIQTSNSTGIPLPWMPLNVNAGNRYELHTGSAANSWQSLEIMGVPGELTGIMQKVYLPVPRSLRYRVAFYAKHLSGPDEVAVSFRSRQDGRLFSTAALKVEGTDWKRYDAVLELKPTDVQRLEAVNFGLAVTGTERAEVDQISLAPADAVEGLFDPTVLKLSDEMHMTELRLGGNFSSYYHWRDGVGPRDKRMTTKNIAWGIPEYNNFGTDEFLAFCRLVHAEPQFNLNMGSGTPEEAVDWVKYIRERYHGPLILEMGNELYGKWQVGYPTVSEIAQRTLAFSRALRPISQNATLMATGDVPNHFDKWNAAQLSNPPGTFDLLTMHLIVGTNHVKLSPYTPDFMAAAAYAVPVAVGAKLDQMQAQVDAAPGFRGRAEFAVTEWLFNSKGEGERNFTNESPSSRNQGGAVMIASTFNLFFRHNKQIKLVDMTGLMEFAGIWKRREQVFASPPYYVFKMYGSAKNETVLPVNTDSGTYDVKNGTPGYADVNDVPYLDVAATRSPDGKSLTLFCINRSLSDDANTEFDLQGFVPADSGMMEQMRSDSRYTRNDEVDPKRIVPHEMTLTRVEGKPFQITLPRESVTVIRLHQQ